MNMSYQQAIIYYHYSLEINYMFKSRTRHAQRSSNSFKATLTHVGNWHACFFLIRILCKCQHLESRKKPYQVCKEGGHFQHATGRNYAKAVLSLDKDKRAVKGKCLTPLYRRWGQLCSCIQGYCYCCSQILLSPVHI